MHINILDKCVFVEDRTRINEYAKDKCWKDRKRLQLMNMLRITIEKTGRDRIKKNWLVQIANKTLTPWWQDDMYLRRQWRKGNSQRVSRRRLTTALRRPLASSAVIAWACWKLQLGFQLLESVMQTSRIACSNLCYFSSQLVCFRFEFFQRKGIFQKHCKNVGSREDVDLNINAALTGMDHRWQLDK